MKSIKGNQDAWKGALAKNITFINQVLDHENHPDFAYGFNEKNLLSPSPNQFLSIFALVKLGEISWQEKAHSSLCSSKANLDTSQFLFLWESKHNLRK